MGIDIHTLNFLRCAKKKKPLGDTITIGRQVLGVDEQTVRGLVGAPSSYKSNPYCEELLTGYFGANKVDSDKISLENVLITQDALLSLSDQN